MLARRTVSSRALGLVHLRLPCLLPPLVLALQVAACENSEAFSRRGDQVLVPDEFSSCEQGDSCILTGSSCSHCCGAAAVRLSAEERVFRGVQAACDEYDGSSCGFCQAARREATCIAGRCTLLHSGLCVVGTMRFAPGDGDIQDPFSCNKCVCQEDGSLRCDEQACARPCSAGMAPGTSCDRCGYNQNCDELRSACLPSCATDVDCGGTPGGRCLDGVCKRVCGYRG